MDIMSGDELVSDSYPHEVTFEGACLQIKSKLITKKNNEDFGISSKLSFYLFLTPLQTMTRMHLVMTTLAPHALTSLTLTS